MARVIGVCVSEKKGTMKHEVPEVNLRKEWGIEGDAHAGAWHRQVSLLGKESVDRMRKTLPNIAIGAFAENIQTEGITLYELPVGTKLRIGETLLEVTQIGKQCHYDCEIRRLAGDCVMPREGIFARVLQEGKIKPGDSVEIVLS